MDLKEFYNEHIKTDEYHYKFFDAINIKLQRVSVFGYVEEIESSSFEVFDEEEAITNFKKICQTGVEFSIDNTVWFYLLTYYLHKNGYTLNMFPRILARPPKDPLEFTYEEIRNRIISRGEDVNGVVSFASRRKLIEGFEFKKGDNDISLDDSIDKKFQDISNRKAPFNSMSVNEKLAEIANLIENLLNKNGKFRVLNYSEYYFDFISDNTIKQFRKKLHCFRHATDEAIRERETFTEEQKYFFVEYGLVIINVIHSLLNRS